MLQASGSSSSHQSSNVIVNMSSWTTYRAMTNHCRHIYSVRHMQETNIPLGYNAVDIHELLDLLFYQFRTQVQFILHHMFKINIKQSSSVDCQMVNTRSYISSNRRVAFRHSYNYC